MTELQDVDMVRLGEFWLPEIKTACESFEKWIHRGHKIIERYRDQRDAIDDGRRRYNILWSNVQVLKPALYGRKASPEVSRRFKDKDPVGRTAALMLERCLQYEVDQYTDFDTAMKYAVEDRLLPGRGVAWVRYETPGDDPQVSEDKRNEQQYECVPVDYVNWQDFTHTPARTWEEVWWVARRVWMTKEEGEKRFGEIFKDVPLLNKSGKTEGKETPKDALKKKAQVWEIWDKTDKRVIWIAEGYPMALDVKDDFLGLEGFYPCPKPLYATITTGSLIPVPDYCEYQDQAEELDNITNRISLLTKALKVVGIFDASSKAIIRILNEGMDNTMIPVDSWAAFAEKGGIKGAMQFLPVLEVAQVLERLYVAREQVKQVIYEVMGISDILRGSTKANETLGAQQLKAQFGSMRIKLSQQDVAEFASDILRKKSQIICRFFDPQTIIMMSGIEHTDDVQYAGPALELLKQGEMRDFRINVEADSLSQIDEDAEKAARIELLSVAGTFLKEALPVIQAGGPQVGKLLGELLLFTMRGFRVGKTLEGAFETALDQMNQPQQPAQPNPAEMAKSQAETMKAQAEMQVVPIRAQAEMAKAQASMVTSQNQLQAAQMGGANGNSGLR
jgi:hypothetical protein